MIVPSENGFKVSYHDLSLIIWATNAERIAEE